MIVLAMAGLGGPALAQQFDQFLRPVVTLTDPAMIDQTLAELLILPPDSVTALRMIDLTGNGFGPDDIVLLLPGEEVYTVESFVPARLQQAMQQWRSEADYTQEAARGESEAILLDAIDDQDPAAAIFGACTTAIDTHYGGDDLDLLLSRDAGTIRLEMWNYDPLKLAYTPPDEEDLCRMDPQRFQFARPVSVSAFIDGGRCIEAWQEEGTVYTKPCPK